MQWGDAWGTAWGGPIGDIQDSGARAKARLIDLFREATNLNDLLEVLAERYDALENLAAGIQHTWYLPAAYGWMLDVIGRIINFERLGYDEPTYRKLLGVAAQLVSRSKATTPMILAVVEALSEGADPVVKFRPNYPAGYVVTAPVSPGLSRLLMDFLEKASAGGVSYVLHVEPVSDVLLVDDTTTPVATPLVVDDTTTPVPGAGLITATIV